MSSTEAISTTSPQKTTCAKCDTKLQVVHNQMPGPVEDFNLPIEVQIPVPTDVGAKYFHSDDHSKLVGVLYRHEPSNTWRLKYAEPETVDEFGGIVTLAATMSGPMQLRSGMVVSVQGQVQKQADNATCPDFIASEVQVVAP
jgi:hypothetical protein